MSLVWIALAIAGGPLLVAGVLTAVVRKRAPGPRARPCTIRDLTNVACGRVVGIVRVYEKTLTAPMTRMPCVFYRHGRSVWSYFRGTGLWSEIEWVAGEQGSVEFLLEDDSGVAILELADAELSFANIRIEQTVETGKSRTIEQVIVPGQRLEVIGAAIEEADPDGQSHDSLRRPPPARLRIVAAAGAKLFVTDRGQ